MQLTNTINSMIDKYSSAQICPYDNQKCKDGDKKWDLEPGKQQIVVANV